MSGYNPSNRGKGKCILWLRENARHKGDACLVWPFYRDPSNGYGHFGYLGKQHYAHRFMCQLAHGEPPTKEHTAAHNCGKGGTGCVNPHHLAWKTPSENQYDRRRHGTHVTSIWGSGGKLTNKQKAEIRALRGRVTQVELGKRYGVPFQTISRIQLENPDRPKKYHPWQPEEKLRLIALTRRGLPPREIVKHFPSRSYESVVGRQYKLKYAGII